MKGGLSSHLKPSNHKKVNEELISRDVQSCYESLEWSVCEEIVDEGLGGLGLGWGQEGGRGITGGPRMSHDSDSRYYL